MSTIVCLAGEAQGERLFDLGFFCPLSMLYSLSHGHDEFLADLLVGKWKTLNCGNRSTGTEIRETKVCDGWKIAALRAWLQFLDSAGHSRIVLMSLYRVGDARANRASSMKDDETMSVKNFLLCLVL